MDGAAGGDDVHPFYSVVRGVALTIVVPLASLFAFQVCLDRKELRRLRRWSNADRMYRLGGLIGSMSAVIAHVDFYGVFGIYPPIFPSILFAFMICSALIPLLFAWFKASISSCSFLPNETQERVQRITLVIFIVVGPINNLLIVLSAITESALTRFVGAVLIVPSVLIFVAGVNYLYYKLRVHMKEMEAADANNSSKTPGENKPLNSLSAKVRSWRIYAVLMSIILLIAMPISALRARDSFARLRDGSARFEENINTIVSPSEPLSGSHNSILLSLLLVAIYGVFAWKSWKRVRRSSASSSGTKPIMTSSSGMKPTSSVRLKPSQNHSINSTVVPRSSDSSAAIKVDPASESSPKDVV